MSGPFFAHSKASAGGTATQNGGTAGRVVGQIVTQTRYNDNGFPEALVDDKGNSTVQEYNARDLRTDEIYPDGTRRTWSHDRETNVLEAVDNNGTRVLSRYNDVDLPVHRDILRAAGVEGTTFENYQYDGLYRMTLAENDFARTALRYDSLSRVFEETQQIRPFPAKTIRRTFDAVGNKTGLTYPSGRVLRMVPDALNRIDRIEELSHPFLAGQNPLVAKYAYAGPSRLVRREHGNGTFLEIAYDAVKRPVRWEHRTVDPFQGIAGSKVPGLIAGFEYVYDRVRNKRMERFLHQKGQPGDVFRYDSLSRLVDAALEVEDPLAELSLPGTEDLERRQTWTLDGVGNWTRLVEAEEQDEPVREISFVVNPLNQYTAIDGVTQRHDANGNLIERTAEQDTLELLEEGVDSRGDAEAEAEEGGDLLRFLFLYDYRNQLVRAQVQQLDEEERTFKTERVIHFAYDTLGRRVFRAVEGHASERGENASTSGRAHRDRGLGDEQGAGHGQFLAFYWDGQQLVEERDERDQPVRLYTLGRGFDDWIAMDVLKDFEGRVFFHENSLGSTAALTDSAGAVLERVTYTPYGRPQIARAQGGGNRPRSRIGNRILFTGREFDFDTPLYDYRARAYDPLVGRFLERDPAEADMLLNPYTYAANAPTVFTDPLGLYPDVAGAIAEASRHLSDPSKRVKETGNRKWVLLSVSEVSKLRLETRRLAEEDIKVVLMGITIRALFEATSSQQECLRVVFGLVDTSQPPEASPGEDANDQSGQGSGYSGAQVVGTGGVREIQFEDICDYPVFDWEFQKIIEIKCDPPTFEPKRWKPEVALKDSVVWSLGSRLLGANPFARLPGVARPEPLIQ